MIDMVVAVVVVDGWMEGTGKLNDDTRRQDECMTLGLAHSSLAVEDATS